MAENVVSIVTRQVGAPAGSWIKDQICYVYNFDRYVDNFNDQLHNLKLKRERIEHAVNDATRRKMELIQGEVKHWLHRVITLINDKAEAFLRETERAKNGCLFGICPNVKARYQLSKKAEDLSKDAADLLSAAEKFTSVSYCPLPQGIRFPTIKEYETFESRARHFEKIMIALKDPNVNMIGVWGMGGVGKTTLVKKVAEQADVEKIFDMVVLSEVSLNQDLRKVQGDIAEGLGFKFEAETISVRSIQLRKRLQKETKILVILDNIWEFLDLGELGMPGDHKGCKILMTSRNKRVLDEIGTDCLNIKVDTLENVEAWNLFEKRAGDVVEVPNLLPIAIKIAKKCAGLPILIASVARALRSTKDPHTWKDALQQLERFENDDLDKRVHSALELSYNNLGSRMMKQLFLLCGQLVNTDYAIEDLVSYCVTLDAFKNIDLLEDRRNKLHKLVEDLKSACLLLDGEKNGYIKMHDLVRKFALNFAREKHNMFIEEYDGELEEWPKNNTVAKFSSICFPHNFIHRLQERLECEELKLFILHSKNRYLEIPSSFFQGVRGIMVLDVKNLIIPSLPSSLCYLKNLCTLSLENCKLEDIGIIGNLVGLEVLRIVNTNLSRLPEEIGQLTRLKLVNVSKCYNLKVIPPNVISSWTRLEELSMEKSFVNWKAEGVNGQNASLAELNKLSKLVSLDIHIPNFNIMANYSFSDKLKRFKILIGDGWDWDWNWEWSSKYESSRRLKLKLSTRIHLKPDVQALLRKTEDLYLNELVDVNSVSELDREGFPRLRFLHVQNGRNFQYIVNSNTRVPCNIFPDLEVLSLKNLNNLEMICHGQLGVESFNKLRIVKVRSCEEIIVNEPISLLNGKILRQMEFSCCHKLRFLFPIGVVTSLIQLESLMVRECKLMEGIIEGVADQMIFPKLRSVNLGHLPELKGFCIGNSIEFPSLSDVRINGCPKLKSFIFDEKKISNDDLPPPLFDEKVSFRIHCTDHILEELSLFDIGSGKIWDNNLLAMPLCFQTLREMKLSGCHKLRFLFPIGVVTSLIQLESLTVRECKLMEGIIEGVADQMIIPKLRSVNLGHLPELKGFCIGNSIEFPSLSDVRINGCPKLKSFIFDEKKISNDDLPPPLFDEKIVLPNLEKLSLFDIGSGKIWDNNLLAMPLCFQTLREMKLSGCHKLRFLFPIGVVTSLIQLESLTVRECKLMEGIIEGVADQMIFPKLRSVNLGHLPELKACCIGNFIEFPSLSDVRINGCPKLKSFIFDEKKISNDDLPPPLFDEKIVLPNLEKLSLFDIGSGKIWDNNLLAMPLCFQTLREMKLSGCHKLRFLFPIGVVTSLIQLESLMVRECKLMEGIIEGVADQMIFPKLRSVNPGHLPELKGFCIGNSIEFPSLSDVRINGCPKLKSFIFDEKKISNDDLPPPLFDEKIVLPNLEKLSLFDIGSEKIWDNNFLAMPLCFQTLREMELSGFHKLRFLFPVGVVTSLIQLESLVVQDCKLMEGIIEGVAGQMIFPKLRSLNLENLPELKTFCTGNSIEFPSLSHMWINGCPELKSFISDEKKVSNDDLPSHLFDEKVKLPTIESLFIWSINLKRIWHNVLAQESFCKLYYLLLWGCENLLNIFPSNMLTRLQNLQTLWIDDCKSIDVIFDLEGSNGLLMHITKAPVFRKLKSINIYDCPRLKYIFPLSIGIGLHELEELDIERCGAVEKIVAMEGVEADVRFEFPNVTSLILEDLPQVRSFYPGIHTSEWPLLKKLKVYKCGNVEEGVHVEQPLFLYEKEIFPHIEELSLSWNYIMKQMWKGEFQFEMFCRLKSLEIFEYRDESFPPGFFKKLPNLEKLSIEYSTFDEIFPNGGVIGEAGEFSAFCTLKILRLTYCDGLKILFPSSQLSFCNLIELRISDCNGLTGLMSCSTAKRMMQLERLKVYGCKMMTSIVECVGECEAEDHIIFHQLKKLKIDGMPNLSSFSRSTKHAFKFPSLEDVYVVRCPNLKTFCEGPLSTFKLRSVHLSSWGIEEHWNGDLNTTIQTLYKEEMIIRIQRRFRRHVVSRDFIALRMASIVIQSAVRGNIARQMFESLKGEIVLKFE